MLKHSLPPTNRSPAPPRPRLDAAFSLSELLVIVGILLVLSLLAFPQFSRAAERSRAARCVHKLRQIGVLMHGVIGENNGRLQLFIDGSAGGEKRWYNQAMAFAGYSQEQAKAAFGCPSFQPDETNDWFCYGMRVAGSPGGVRRDTPESPRFYNLQLSNVPNPAEILWMSDSLNYASGRQSFRFYPPGIKNDAGIHLRHFGRANVLFLDGHLKVMDAAALAQQGITHAVNDEAAPFSTALP